MTFHEWWKTAGFVQYPAVDGKTVAEAAWNASQRYVHSADVATLLRGFEEGAFVRNTAQDHEPGWAVKLVPYLAALGRLAQAKPQPSSLRVEPHYIGHRIRIFCTKCQADSLQPEKALPLSELHAAITGFQHRRTCEHE